jgi:hypothetical protein
MLREVLHKYGLVDELSGSTHFLVARKTGQPNYEYYQPLYDITKIYSSNIPSGTYSPKVIIPVKEKK